MNAWSLRSVYTRSLAAMAGATAGWTVAVAGFAAWIVVIVAQTAHQLAALSQGSPLLNKIITSVGGSAATTNASLLNGLPVGDTLAVLAGAAVLLALASARFMTKDIAS